MRFTWKLFAFDDSRGQMNLESAYMCSSSAVYTYALYNNIYILYIYIIIHTYHIYI